MSKEEPLYHSDPFPDDVVDIIYYGDKTIEEIAEISGRTPQQVYDYYSRYKITQHITRRKKGLTPFEKEFITTSPVPTHILSRYFSVGHSTIKSLRGVCSDVSILMKPCYVLPEEYEIMKLTELTVKEKGQLILAMTGRIQYNTRTYIELFGFHSRAAKEH